MKILAVLLTSISMTALLAGGALGDDYSTQQDFDGNFYTYKNGQYHSRTKQDFDGTYYEQYRDGTRKNYDYNPYKMPKPRYTDSIYE